MAKQYAEYWEHRMDSGLKPDAHGDSMSLWFELRRRESDGFTRVEVTTASNVRIVSSYGESKFTVYLTDDERRSLAKALLEGIEEAH